MHNLQSQPTPLMWIRVGQPETFFSDAPLGNVSLFSFSQHTPVFAPAQADINAVPAVSLFSFTSDGPFNRNAGNEPGLSAVTLFSFVQNIAINRSVNETANPPQVGVSLLTFLQLIAVNRSVDETGNPPQVGVSLFSFTKV